MSLCGSCGATVLGSVRWISRRGCLVASCVRYVDYLDADGLRGAYDSTLREGRPLIVPDVVDDGARLASSTDGSLDFVVATQEGAGRTLV